VHTQNGVTALVPLDISQPFSTSALESKPEYQLQYINCCYSSQARYQLFLGRSKFFILLLLHLHVICVWLWVMPPTILLEKILHAERAKGIL